MALSVTLKRFLLLAAAACTLFVAVEATQVMQRPAAYKEPPHKVTPAKVEPKIIHKRADNKVQFAYFTNWGIYGANFQPTDINPAPLTHILYSFADSSPDTGAISLTDSYADQEKHYPGDSWDEAGNNLYGCLKQLYLLKLKQRNIKILLSVGGWTYAQRGDFNFVTDANKRATFVSSAVQLIEDYGFDGIDIDYEFPTNADQGAGLASLVTELRTAFTNLASKKGDKVPYLISAAVSAGPANYAYLDMPKMNAAMDYWNLMAYDYAGSWTTTAENQANVYGGQGTGFSTDAAVKDYLAKGATANKINLGIPIYGRAFENTNGVGSTYNGIGPGTIAAGVYSYKYLPMAGATVYENLTDVASYSYDSAKKELVSYDTPHIVTLKAQYAQSKGFAGAMFWDLSTDKTGDDSLVTTSSKVFGALDQTQNHINYPNSKWDNIKNNMGQGGSTPPSSTTMTTTTTTGTTTPTGNPTGSCAGVPAWTAAAVFTGGQQATYNGHLWTAKWWTQGDTPGGSVGVWTDNGAC
ncbi:glycoside hydrolase superfamily [Daedaleopsis nitida]|nr:glycoside hydrolase superfamily [Daedaleopsis nitida]